MKTPTSYVVRIWAADGTHLNTQHITTGGGLPAARRALGLAFRNWGKKADRVTITKLPGGRIVQDTPRSTYERAAPKRAAKHTGGRRRG